MTSKKKCAKKICTFTNKFSSITNLSLSISLSLSLSIYLSISLSLFYLFLSISLGEYRMLDGHSICCQSDCGVSIMSSKRLLKWAVKWAVWAAVVKCATILPPITQPVPHYSPAFSY